MDDPFAFDLGKRPRMLVTGLPVTVDQAREIIRRTDSFFRGEYGNDHDFIARVEATLGIPHDYSLGDNPEICSYEKWKELHGSWSKKWGLVNLECVYNSWISAYEPNGWCYPDGSICWAGNVGRWPTVKDVFSDWVALSQAFPFLDIGVTLMNEGPYPPSADEIKKLVSFRIEKGVAAAVDPKIEDVHAGHPIVQFRGYKEPEYSGFDKPLELECGIPLHWIEQWAEERKI